MTDPRADNCRGYDEVGGKVTGVKLEYLPASGTKYELIRAELVDEIAAQGNTTATIQVLDKENIPARVNCYLAWPWEGWLYPGGFQNQLLPGNPNIPYQHVISNPYNPQRLGPNAESGPLAICIGDKDGNVISDVIGGLGLPKGHHVSYDLVFKERGDTPDPDPDPDADSTSIVGALAAIVGGLIAIATELRKLREHLGG